MMSTFIYIGWEGTAKDSRVFINVLNRQEIEFPHPEEDKKIVRFFYI